MSLALARKQKEFILWPSTNELREVKRGFYSKGRFPGVIGCVDETLSMNENDFVNRNDITQSKYKQCATIKVGNAEIFSREWWGGLL